MVETKVYEINPVSRVINIPSSTVIGVESDENVERIRFQCDRFVGDNVDLSSFNLYVNYQNANGEKNVYLIEDVIADDSTIAFSWLLSREVTKYKGFIKFIVCAKRSNSTTNEWNTRVATASVIEGLEADAVIEEQKIDVLEQILARLTALEAGGGSGGGTVSPEDIQTAVDNYLDENPVQGAVSWSNKQIMLFEALLSMVAYNNPNANTVITDFINSIRNNDEDDSGLLQIGDTLYIASNANVTATQNGNVLTIA